MVNQERPPILTDEYMLTTGSGAFMRYAYEAQNSEVPTSFLSVSHDLSLNYYPEIMPVDFAEIILEIRFEDDRQAWLALKYAEAMAAIKMFNSGLEFDFDGPITSKEELNKMYLRIGIAVLSESEDDTTEAVKLAVEDYFENHPEASLRLDYLTRMAQEGTIH